MSDPRRRHARRPEEFTSEQFVEATGIFDRVVEMNFLQSVKPLSWIKPAKLQGQGRFVIKRAKAAGGPFEMNANLFIGGISFRDWSGHVLAVASPQFGSLLGRNVD